MTLAASSYHRLLKAVVDIERELIALDAKLHSDLEQLFLEDGSAQKDLWGINLQPMNEGDDFVEFDSMINIRPDEGNFSRGVESPEIQERIRTVVRKLIL